MNAPREHPVLAEPRWREHGFMQSLGPAFWTELPAQPLPEVHWVARSDALAADLGLADWLRSDRALQVLSGNAAARERPALASVYSGHQFGVWAGQLGDGRALLLGEIESPIGRQEIQLKGSGLTPYSRMGDGRAVLRSSIREFLCSEAMHHLGIPTTRALAVVGSPAPVMRENVETAAVVTRVAPSFLRFGHFEHFAHTADDAAPRVVAVIDRFHPECRDAPAVARPVEEVAAQRRLMAQSRRGLLPWRDEHTTCRSWSDDRLRAVRVFTAQPDAHLQPQRPPGPICPGARRRLVNLHALAQLAARARGRGAANAWARSALRSSRSAPEFGNSMQQLLRCRSPSSTR
jgi:hypothetical protein